MNFPNLERYDFQSFDSVSKVSRIYKAYDKLDKTLKLFGIFNLRQVNLDSILVYFKLNKLRLGTDNKNIIKLYEVGTTYNGLTDYLYLVMDYDFIRLDSLENKFNNNDMTLENSIKIICQILDGLNHAHKYNIIHRNITTDFILNKNNETKLSNYHLLFTPSYFSKDENLTLLSYKAPDFFYEKKRCNYLTDIYSIGIVLFRCVNQFDNWLDVIKPVDNLKHQVKTSNLINYIGYKNHVTNDIKTLINKTCGHSLDNYYTSVLGLKQDLINLFDIKN